MLNKKMVIRTILNGLFNVLIDFAKTTILVGIICAIVHISIDFKSFAIVWACAYFIKIYFGIKTHVGLEIKINS